MQAEDFKPMELERAEKEIKERRLLHSINRLRQISRLLHYSCCQKILLPS